MQWYKLYFIAIDYLHCCIGGLTVAILIIMKFIIFPVNKSIMEQKRKKIKKLQWDISNYIIIL